MPAGSVRAPSVGSVRRAAPRQSLRAVINPEPTILRQGQRRTCRRDPAKRYHDRQVATKRPTASQLIAVGRNG